MNAIFQTVLKGLKENLFNDSYPCFGWDKMQIAIFLPMKLFYAERLDAKTKNNMR